MGDPKFLFGWDKKATALHRSGASFLVLLGSRAPTDNVALVDAALGSSGEMANRCLDTGESAGTQNTSQIIPGS